MKSVRSCLKTWGSCMAVFLLQNEIVQLGAKNPASFCRVVSAGHVAHTRKRFSSDRIGVRGSDCPSAAPDGSTPSKPPLSLFITHILHPSVLLLMWVPEAKPALASSGSPLRHPAFSPRKGGRGGPQEPFHQLAIFCL